MTPPSIYDYWAEPRRWWPNGTEVTVTVIRRDARGPIQVMSREAQPLGQHYRYRDHVDPEDVCRVVAAWLADLPENYCLTIDCAEVRTYWWGELRERLGQVPCIERVQVRG